MNAAFDEFYVTVHGQPGHGAYPHTTIDPIGILASIIVGVNELASRAIDPTHATVMSIGRIEGGNAPNVIAGTAYAAGTIRTTDDRDREQLHHDLRRLVELTAAARGATAELSIVPGGSMLVNEGLPAYLVDQIEKEHDLSTATVGLLGMATGETIACLNYLRLRGAVQSSLDAQGVAWYSAT